MGYVARKKIQMSQPGPMDVGELKKINMGKGTIGVMETGKEIKMKS